MTFTEMVTQVKHLSNAEKLALLKVLADSLGEEAPKSRRKRSLKSLYGILRPKDGVIPSNQELREGYIDYLVEKYK